MSHHTPSLYRYTHFINYYIICDAVAAQNKTV